MEDGIPPKESLPPSSSPIPVVTSLNTGSWMMVASLCEPAFQGEVYVGNGEEAAFLWELPLPPISAWPLL